MSKASERLRELDAIWADLEIQATRERSHFYVASVAKKTRNALPLIADVVDQFEAFVEIHERSRDPWREIEERLRNLAPDLLTALRDALQDGSSPPPPEGATAPDFWRPRGECPEC